MQQKDILTKNEIISLSNSSLTKRVVRLDFLLKHAQKTVISHASLRSPCSILYLFFFFNVDLYTIKSQPAGLQIIMILPTFYFILLYWNCSLGSTGHYQAKYIACSDVIFLIRFFSYFRFRPLCLCELRTFLFIDLFVHILGRVKMLTN